MKALVLKEYKQFRIEDLPLPEYGSDFDGRYILGEENKAKE